MWKFSTCSDGRRGRGTLTCEECLKYEAPVKGEQGTKAKESAGVSAPTLGEETIELDIAENDLKKCNVCSGPFAIRGARRQDQERNCSTNECGCAFVSTQTSRSWIYTCRSCQRHLCTDCHAKEVGKAPTMRAYASAATPPSAAPPVVEPELEKDKSHERLLFLLSKIDALPQIQTIQWIPRGLDRRYAAVRLQALDKAIQAAKANTAASTKKLWSEVALLIPHLILRMKPGHKEQGDGLGSIRDEIRKRFVLAEKGYLEQLLMGVIDDQEKKNSERKRKKVRVPRTKKMTASEERQRQLTEGNCGQRPDCSEAPSSSHRQKRR